MENIEQSWEIEKELDTLTIKDLEELCEHAFSLKAEIERHEEVIESLKGPLEETNRKIEFFLTKFGKKKWDSKYGNIEIRQNTSVKIPRTESDKAALFKWLQDKGIFWQTVGVNSQTLNSLYKAEAEAAFSGGKDVVIPGISEPEIYTKVILKRSK